MKWLQMWRFCRGYGIITLEGCLVERLLEQFRKNNLPLWNVTRTKSGVRFCTLQQGIAFVQDYCSEHPRAKIQVRLCGRLRFAAWTRRHAVLCIMLTTLAIAAVGMSCFYWTVDVSNVPASHREAVLETLQDAQIDFPMRKSALQRSRLRDHLLLEIPDFSFAEVHGHGITLQIDVVLRAQAPQVLDVSAAKRDIVAPCDGKILSIAVTSGTAMVQAGDNVQKGDALILGVAGRPGFERDVTAQGKIQMLVTYKDSVQVDVSSLAVRTGKTDRAQSVVLFDRAIPLRDFSSAMDEYKEEVSRLQLFSPIMQLPFYIETVTRREVTCGTAQQQLFYAQQLALGKTMQNMHERAQIIDTYYEHTCQNGTIYVSCTLTTKLMIATTQEVHAQ